jgi:flagellar biosynthesis component FlhA
VDGERFGGPFYGKGGAIVELRHMDACRMAGFSTWNGPEWVLRVVEFLLSTCDGSLVNRSTTEFYLLRLRETHPELAATLQEQFSVAFLTRVIRALVTGGVSLRQCVSIFDAILGLSDVSAADTNKFVVFSPLGIMTKEEPEKWTAGEARVEKYIGFARSSLRRYITSQLQSGNMLSVYLMDPKWEELLTRKRPLPESERVNLSEAVATELEFSTDGLAVVLTTDAVRIPLAEELRAEFPHVRVISYPELSPDVNITPLARIHRD